MAGMQVNTDLAAAVRSGRLNSEDVARLLEGQEPTVRLTAFDAGSEVELVHVSPGARSSTFGEPVARETVGDDSVVEFSGPEVVVGGHYYAVGPIDGEGREVFAMGKVPALEPEPSEAIRFEPEDREHHEPSASERAASERAARIQEVEDRYPSTPAERLPAKVDGRGGTPAERRASKARKLGTQPGAVIMPGDFDPLHPTEPLDDEDDQ